MIRAGYGRSYDIGVFGSLFGHTVTQNLPVLAAQSITRRTSSTPCSTLAQGPPDPSFVQPGADGTFPWPDGVKPLVLPRKQRPPTVDAWNVTVQRQLSSTMSVEVAYVGNYGRHVFSGDNPDDDFNTVSLEGFITPGCTATPCIPANQRRPFFAGGIRAERPGCGRQLRVDRESSGVLQRGAQLVQGHAGQIHEALFGRAGLRRSTTRCRRRPTTMTTTGSTTPT